jgi:branched-chain amino acid transport system substrate-binding protein
VVAAQLAAEEAAAWLPGVKIEVIGADHQNKADIASSVTRDWMANRAVNVVADVPFSSAGLAVSEAVRGAPRTIFIASGSGTSDMTGKSCSPNTVQWTYDTYATGNVVARALVAQGLKSWFFISADYAFGAALERDTSQTVKALGGTVVGGIKNPAFASDFSSYLVAAQSSPAQVIAIANASIDMINLVKQAHEFGIVQSGKQLATLLTLITDIESIGLETAQGLYLASPFYWDLNDRTRAFTKRLGAKTDGKPADMEQAGAYGGTLHYLKAVAAMGVEAARADGAATIAQMKKMPTDDDAFGVNKIREDGRLLCPAYLFEVKKPSESKGRWDYYKLSATTSGEDAAMPLAEEHCKLVKS